MALQVPTRDPEVEVVAAADHVVQIVPRATPEEQTEVAQIMLVEDQVVQLAPVVMVKVQDVAAVKVVQAVEVEVQDVVEVQVAVQVTEDPINPKDQTGLFRVNPVAEHCEELAEADCAVQWWPYDKRSLVTAVSMTKPRCKPWPVLSQTRFHQALPQRQARPILLLVLRLPTSQLERATSS